MAGGTEYSHTQKGILQPILLVSAAVFLVLPQAVRGEPALPAVCVPLAAFFVLLSFAFARLTVRDEGARLAVRFGPLPVLRKSIPYAAMTGVGRERSTFLAGWGIHWTPRGWLWNIGGFDCVRIDVGPKSTFIGTDDPDRLVAFLRSRICRESAGPTGGPETPRTAR
jgi:hypothetical protein